MTKSRIVFAFLSCLALVGCEAVGSVGTLGGGDNNNNNGGPDAGNPGGGDAGGGGDAAMPTPQSVLNAFGQCMTLEDWTANNMNLIAGTPDANGTPCSDGACHGAGQGTLRLVGDPALDLATAQVYPTILPFATTDVALVPVVSTTIPDKQLDPGPTHAAFTLPAEVNIQGFFDATLLKYNAGNCTP